MTTVAFDGRYLAADTMGHRSGVPSNIFAPKITVRDGFAYAINGSWMPMIDALIDWHKGGARPGDFPEIKTAGGMMVVKLITRRVWLVSTDMPVLDEEAAPITGGSGGDVALGAMHAGKTAMEAVQIAAKCDVHTNDVIDFVDLDAPAWAVQRWGGTMPVPDGAFKAEAHPDADEEGRTRIVAHELAHTMYNGRPLTTTADLCLHGFVRRTCSRCRHETYPYPAA
jgi:hypothetical protein